MVVAIHQPEHLPWLGFLDKASRADVLVLLDNVQFKKRYFDNRNRIRTAMGWTWVTVPVRSKGRYHQHLQTAEIDTERTWQPSYWRSLALNYGRAPFFGLYRDRLRETFVDRTWTRLVDLNVHLIQWALDEFGLAPGLVAASTLGVAGSATDLLLGICRELKATVYLSGISGRQYLDDEQFRASGIEVSYQEFRHPVYRQLYEPFEPCMAFVDLLLNHGPASRAIMLDPAAPRLDTVFT